jgi:phenylacetate-coenzyme A ligase PaaK-like adenylate-forming protein
VPEANGYPILDAKRRCLPPSYVPRSATGASWPVQPLPLVGQFLALANQLLANEWRAPERIRAQQLAQLRMLTAHAARHSDFHAERFGAAKISPSGVMSLEDLRRLSPMNRGDLQNGFDAIRCRKLPRGMVVTRVTSTSGSSGVPVRVGVTNIREQVWVGTNLRSAVWAGKEPSERMGIIRTLSKVKLAKAHLPEGAASRVWAGVMGKLLVTGPSFGMDVGMNVDVRVAFLKMRKVQCLVTFPSVIAELAEHAVEHGILLPDLRLVQTFTEVLTPSMVRRVRDLIGVPVVDMYSCEEVGNIASSCPAGHGYHVHDEGVLLEVVDDDGEPCAPGETGRVLVTDLVNYAFPLIRYELGDLAVAGEAGVCPCGRGLSRLKRIEGRTWSRVVAMDGSRCCASVIRVEMTESPQARQYDMLGRMRQFRFVQKERGSIDVLVVPRESFGVEHEEYIVRSVRRRLGEQMAVNVKRVERIDRLPSGKFVDTICEV